MKTLFVLRHAAASSDGSAPTDFDRRLNRRGQQQALGVGAMMRANRFEFDAIVASPATRVVETIAGISDGAGRAMEPIYDPRAYNASLETLVGILREADDKFDRMLIVGHNPGLQQLLLHLAEPDREDLHGTVASDYRTAALAELCLAVDQWRDIGPRSGRIVSMVHPGEGN